MLADYNFSVSQVEFPSGTYDKNSTLKMSIAARDSERLILGLRELRRAALSDEPVTGLTHRHYKYPARFSPRFVAAAISAFSRPNDIVLDPYVGGGTTLVEGFAAGRQVIGCDVNSLALFVSRAKTITLSRSERELLTQWATNTIGEITYRDTVQDAEGIICAERTRNLEIPRARPIKKFIALALLSLAELPNEKAQTFARCAILNVGQWALNGRKQAPPLSQFRERLADVTRQMIGSSMELAKRVRGAEVRPKIPTLIHASAEHLPLARPFLDGTLANLVVTSPPYPGVHVLYHRWQVDGRRETPAPYWIAGCLDGYGGTYYNFGSRKQRSHEDYFDVSLRTLSGIRQVMRRRAVIVQMVAFSDPRPQLRKYLANMEAAGFREVRFGPFEFRRVWRNVPGRNWHADQKGITNSAREVVLVHEAI